MLKFKNKAFTPLEKAADFSRRLLPHKADGGSKPPSGLTVREHDSSLTGFTLIESLFSIGLVAMIAVIFFSSLLASVAYLRKSFELRTSSLILQEQISLVRELQYSDIQSLGSTFSSAYMAALKNAAGTAYKSYYGGSDKILKLTFKLDWTTFDSKPASRSIVTLVTDHGIDKK